MAVSYKTYSKTGELARKYVNASEGAIIYSIGKTRFMALAKEANAIYKVGNSALVNMEILDTYLEKFVEPSIELVKHSWVDKKNT